MRGKRFGAWLPLANVPFDGISLDDDFGFRLSTGGLEFRVVVKRQQPLIRAAGNSFLAAMAVDQVVSELAELLHLSLQLRDRRGLVAKGLMAAVQVLR